MIQYKKLKIISLEYVKIILICTRISFVTHTIIRVCILWYKYNYMSSCTYFLSFVLHKIIRVIILGYAYTYMSIYDIYVNICD